MTATCRLNTSSSQYRKLEPARGGGCSVLFSHPLSSSPATTSGALSVPSRLANTAYAMMQGAMALRE
jgi:hypothetical protein